MSKWDDYMKEYGQDEYRATEEVSLRPKTIHKKNYGNRLLRSLSVYEDCASGPQEMCVELTFDDGVIDYFYIQAGKPVLASKGTILPEGE